MFRIITKLVTGRRPSMQLAPSRAVRRRSGACTLPHGKSEGGVADP